MHFKAHTEVEVLAFESVCRHVVLEIAKQNDFLFNLLHY